MNTIPNHIITRSHYLNKVKPFIDQSIIKVFTGQRRVGKSYLLFQLMDYIKTVHSEPSIVYINKEDLAFSFLTTAEGLVSYVNEKASKTSTWNEKAAREHNARRRDVLQKREREKKK